MHSLKAYSSHGANPPLLLFPEEAATNGRAGLLRFRYRERVLWGHARMVLALGSLTAEFSLSSSWPFSLADVVQPVALHVQRPLVTVVSGGSGWGELGTCAGGCSWGCVLWGFLAVPIVLLLPVVAQPGLKSRLLFSAFPRDLLLRPGLLVTLVVLVDVLAAQLSSGAIWLPGLQYLCELPTLKSALTAAPAAPVTGQVPAVVQGSGAGSGTPVSKCRHIT